MSAELRSFRSELDSLRAELEALRVTVVGLRARVEELEGRETGYPQTGGSGSGDTEFTVIPHSTAADTIATGDHEGRAELARNIGAFLRRCLAGEDRGTSGRSRLKLQSRIYVVLADYQGNRFPAPRIYREFAPVASLCKKGPLVGASIFVGLPTEWEARLALEEAGLSWPEGGAHAG